jgi:nucleolin
VFCGNLPWDVDEQALRDLFGGCGEIASVRLATDRETGDFKGFGHVEFASTESTDKALELAGTDLNGRNIRVDYAPGRSSAFSPHGGGGGGGRGGRGGGFGGGGRGGGGGRFGGGGGGRGGFGRGGGGGFGGGGRGRGGGGGFAPRNGGIAAKKNGSIAAFSGNKITFD